MSIFKNNSIISLDLLRGLAAYMVVIPHFFLFGGHEIKVLEFISIFAVEIFFILSGFVLGRQLDKIFKDPTYLNLKVFYLRRWLRTIPIYLIVILSLAAVTKNITFENIFNYLIFTTTWLDLSSKEIFFMPGWSLAVEEWFYLLFPLSLIFFSNIKNKKLTLIFIIIAIFFILKILPTLGYFSEKENIRRITIFRLDAIVFGYLAYLFFTNLSNLSIKNKKLLIFINLIFVILSYKFFINNNYVIFIYASTISAILILINFRHLDNFFINLNIFRKISAYLSKTSYSVYLIHYPLSMLFQNQNGNIIIELLMFLLILQLLSILSYYFVEKPFLDIRPNYNIPKKNINTVFFKNSKILLWVSNSIVFVTVLLVIEMSSNFAFKFYLNYIKNEVSFLKNIFKTSENKEKINDKFLRDKKLKTQVDEGQFLYESYITFKNKKFKSETININKDGLRKTSFQKNNDLNKKNFIIWVFGASPIYGDSNSDDWTIPSRLQYYLNKSNDYNFIVRNYGVVGYSSWQQLLNFQMELSKKEKPDLVFSFAFQNDFLQLFQNLDKNCNNALNTALSSKQILSRSWNNFANNKYIFYNELFGYFIDSYMPTIKQVSNYIPLIPNLINNWRDPKIEKDLYVIKRDRFNNYVDKCSDKVKQYYLNNMFLMASLSQSNNAIFVAGILPEIRSVKKKLTKNELYERYLVEEYFTALSDDDVKKIDFLPLKRINQKIFENKVKYNSNLLDLKNKIQNLANKNNFFILDLMPIADNSPQSLELFSTSIHFTNEGSDYLVKESLKNIENLIKKK